MASDQAFIDYIVDQLREVGQIRYRKMFGEYALYCDEKVVALICDNQLFIKPTLAGRAMIGKPHEAPPYPSAKLHFLVDDKLDNHAWLANLIRLTADELPVPTPKTPKKKAAR
jgi:TfoX/Sxy family transcriptional regulator of competence genes